MKLYVHSCVMMIHIQFKFHKILVIGSLVMANFIISNHFKKGCNLCTTKANLVRLDMYQHVLVIYI